MGVVSRWTVFTAAGLDGVLGRSAQGKAGSHDGLTSQKGVQAFCLEHVKFAVPLELSGGGMLSQ